MGRATILSGGTDGLYSVKLDYGQAAKTARLAALATRLAALAPEITLAQGLLSVQQVLEAMVEATVTSAIDAYVAATRLVPPNAATVAAALKAFTAAQAKLLPEKARTGQLRAALQILENEQAQLLKDQTRWSALVLEETLPAWCADLTEDASGHVATLEIPGENKLVLLAPAAPAPTVDDGLLTAREVQTSYQAFWNAAVLPGWQKFKPTYRRGVITALNTDADTADVTLFAADTSSAQGLGINQAPTLTKVPVQYMTCHAKAFEVGDAVVVKFMGQDWAAPKVVGFVSHPKPCALQRVWVMVSLYDQYTGGTHYTEPRIDTTLVPSPQLQGDLESKVAGYISVPIEGGGYGSGTASVSAASCLYLLASKDLNETKALQVHSGSSTRTASRTYIQNMNTDGDTWNPYNTDVASSYNNSFGKLSGFVGVDGVAVMWSNTLSATLASVVTSQGSSLLDSQTVSVAASTDIRWSDGKPGGLRGARLITAQVSGRLSIVWTEFSYGYQSIGGTPSGALVHKPPAFYEVMGAPRFSLLLNDPAAHFSVPTKYTWEETVLASAAAAPDANGLPYPKAGGGVYATPPTAGDPYSQRWMDLASIEDAFLHENYGSLYRFNYNNKVIGRDWQAYSVKFDYPYNDPALYAGVVTGNGGGTINTFSAKYMPISSGHGFFVNGAARPLRYGPIGTADAGIGYLPALDLRLLPGLPSEMLEVIENGSDWVVDSGFAAVSSRAHNTVNTFYNGKQITVTLMADAKDMLGPDAPWDLRNSRAP